MTHIVHARIDGPLVMIGFGSIGRGTLPLIERHIAFDRDQFTVIEPSGEFAGLLAERGLRHLQLALTPENYAEVLRGLFEWLGEAYDPNTISSVLARCDRSGGKPPMSSISRSTANGRVSVLSPRPRRS